MITITTTLLTEQMKDLALANSVGSIKKTKDSIIFEMTDRMFKPFYEQGQKLLGIGAFTDENIKFQFHNDKYPLLDWK